MRKVWVRLALFSFLLGGVSEAQKSASPPKATLTTIANFALEDGIPYNPTLIKATDGNLYGTMNLGGAYGSGTIYQVTPAGAVNVAYNFCTLANCADGSDPTGVIQASDGYLYGTTQTCYDNNCGGTIYRIALGGSTLETLYTFCSQPNCLDGTNPVGTLVEGSDGNLYGTTAGGGTTYGGTIFAIPLGGGPLTVLHNFCHGSCAGGNYPLTGLVQNVDGNFYGTTLFGGTSGYGIVYEIAPLAKGGTFKVLGSFTQSDGSTPTGVLVHDKTGMNLYGTLEYGGVRGSGGLVYNLSFSGGHWSSIQPIYTFPTVDSGAGPEAGVILVGNQLYGTTYSGGAYNKGVLFKLTQSSGVWSEAAYSFTGKSDGGDPLTGLVSTSTGIYGATSQGGANGYGTVFQLILGN